MNEEPIHVKLEFNEAIQSKKDILNAELHLLKIAKALKRYHLIRSRELKLKLFLYKQLKDIKVDIKKLETDLPKIKIPKLLEKREHFEEEISSKSTTKEKKEHSSIEEELKEIQRKLNSLQG